MILPERDDFQGDHPDIVLHLHPQYYHSSYNNQDHIQLDCISEGHATYAPLHYLLFFPHGEPGWYYEFYSPDNQ